MAKNVVITGGARGFGFAMASDFYKLGYDVVLIDVSEENLLEAKRNLLSDKKGEVLVYQGDITNQGTIEFIIGDVVSRLGKIDVWINNAGVNQLMKPVWELDQNTVSRLIDIDLKGTILCSSSIMRLFSEQGHGQIYNVEGLGSDDGKVYGLSVYGTAKRGVTYFTEALANEVKKDGLPVQVGKITPGIMITNFINHNLGDQTFELSESTKKIYNILGDYPETIARFMVKRIDKNKKNGAKFTWFTKRRAFARFLKAPFSKRDFFKENQENKE